MAAYWSWGWNSSGFTAHGYVTPAFPNIDSPAAPSTVSGSATQLSGGDESGCALNADGTISVWGYHNLAVTLVGSAFGSQFDIAPWDPVLSATQLTYTDAASVVEVSMAHVHTMWRKSNGDVFAIGLNQLGNFGNGEVVATYHDTPTLVFSNAAQISTNLNRGTMILDTSGALWWAGELFRGMQGDGVPYGGLARQYTFTQVPSFGVVTKFWTSGWHIYALLDNGDVYTWGENGNGELGLGDTVKRLSPVLFTALPAAISEMTLSLAGWTYALLVSGSVYAWGFNQDGILGLGFGDITDRHVPTLTASGLTVAYLATTNADPFVAGVVTTDGKLWLTGENNSGQVDYTQTPTNGVFTSSIVLPRVTSAFLLGDQSVFALAGGGRSWVFVLGL